MRPSFATLASMVSLSVCGLAGHPVRAESATDMIEHFFGASNVNAQAGNGGLTIGISSLGDLSVLTWPSPSYTDQVLHVASNALDVREQRQMMLDDSMGATVGFAIATADGSGFTWLREAGWTVTQGYGDPEAAVVETRFARDDLGLEVVLTDLVLTDRDVWVRQVDVTRLPGSPVEDATAIWYGNLAPTVSRVAQLPLADWAYDAFNDYAALYNSYRETLLHFRPAGRGDITELGHLLGPPDVDYGLVGDALAQSGTNPATVDSLMRLIEDEDAPGVYLAVGASSPITDWQVGQDPVDHCALMDTLIDNVLALPTAFPGSRLPLDPSLLELVRCEVTLEDVNTTNGWGHTPESAWIDARDGRLSRSRAAAGRVNTALATPLSFEGDRAAVTFHLAAAGTPSEALSLLDEVRDAPWAALRDATVSWWRDWIGRARLPATDNERVLEVCRRALINLKVGTDRSTGAIVASISRQAPYGLDWPRDGAFFNAALDLAGYPEMVEAHQRFYLDVIRRAPAQPELFINPDPPLDPDHPTRSEFPPWSYEMNYYADGLLGGNIRFEIDNTALVVWSLVAHAGFIQRDTERASYLEVIWPELANATDLLARWRDPDTGLQALANEDDNPAYTQTLHGAVSVYAALSNAARVARARGGTESLLQALSWEARAWELKQAILTHFYDPDSGRFREGLEVSANPQMAKAGPSGWLVWPARLLPFDDPRLVAHLRATLEEALPQLSPETGGGAYLTKLLIAAALALPEPGDRAAVEAGLMAMVERVATPDTAILGETFVAVDTDGDGTNDAFSSRVSNPHLWAATLVYLTAMALYNPERFDPHLEVLPPLVEPGQDRGGCGCSAAAHEPPPVLLLLLLGLLWRRKRM